MKQTRSIKLVQLLDSLMLAIVLAVSAGSIGMAQDFDKGMAAYEAGDYLTTIQEWKPLAESGDANLQYNLGIIYEAMQASTEAALWYRLAADQGMSVAQSALGYKYLKGQGVVQSFVESLKWYRLAADQGSAEGQRRLGDAYALGNGVAQDFSEALKWSLKSAKQGHAAAQTSVGMVYAGGHGVDQDKILGYMWLTLSVNTFGADSEHANTATAWLKDLSNTMTTAEVSLGQEMANTCVKSGYISCDETFHFTRQIPLRGIASETQSGIIDVDSLENTINSNNHISYEQGMAEGRDALANGDYTKAFEQFGFWAIIREDAEAQLMLGAIAADGFGDANNPDYASAYKYYALAAEQNLAPAQLMLGELYRDGKGVPPDYPQAVKWFRLAALQGLSAAQDNLGNLYAKGEGVEQDYTEALKWWRMSAEQGFSYAQSDIGILYEYGKGVLQSNILSYMWYNIAAVNGHDEAAAYRDERAGFLTTLEISKADAMARKCLSSNYQQCGY
jgi:TPR repeat protein